MNVVTRALTQNLRDIRTNWAGSSGFLLRGGAIVATLVVTMFVGSWAEALVRGGATEGPRLLLSLAMKALVGGFGFAAFLGLILGYRASIRLFAAMWLAGSAYSFLTDLPAQGWTHFLLSAAGAFVIGGVSALYRTPLQKYFARVPEHQEPKTP